MISTSYKDIFTLGTGLLRVNRAVLFADVVDSVRLFEVDEEGTILRWVGFVDDLERRLEASGQGRLVKRMGDGLLAEFDDAGYAARTALDIQSSIEKLNENLDADRRIELRIGIDIGEILHSADQDLYGQHVNTAARLSSASRAGQIVTSAAIRNELSSDPDAEFEDIGELHLKNLPRPVSAYVLRNRDEAQSVTPRIASKDLQPTIAVLPLMCPAVSQETMVWSNLITEDLVGALAKSPALSVISNLSTASFRTKPLELEEIRSRLSADFIVSGSFRQSPQQTILDLELIETRTGLVVLSERLEFDTSELLQRNTLFSDLANRMHGALLNRQMKRALSAPLPTLEGYAILFAAIALMNRLSRQDFELARELLDGLIERVPNAPAALAWKARWHVLKVQQGWAREHAKDSASTPPVDALESWKRQFYATIEDDTAALRTRELIGEETLLWGSDYPHTDSTWPCSTQVLDEMFEGYSAETRDRITRTNVANLYSL